MNKVTDLTQQLGREVQSTLKDAQSLVREAKKVIATLDDAPLVNGARGGLDGIKRDLESADEKFTGIYKSLAQTFGDLREKDATAD